MVPRIAELGTSFISAGLYYFHDKISDQLEKIAKNNEDKQKAAADYYLFDKNNQTSERVVYAETLNLPTRDPMKAMKVMAWTAEHAKEIRQNAVAYEAQARRMSLDQYVRKFNPYRGRKLQKPVYAYSLAWHPDQPQPSNEEMVAAAKDTLKVLGLDKHQAVLVIHDDTAHKHIHVICNRLNHHTGLTWSNSNDRLKMSRWAEAYERKSGKILCWERVFNNERRRKGEKVYYHDVPRKDYEWWKKHKHMSPDDIRKKRQEAQEKQRNSLERSKESRLAKMELGLSKAYSPHLNGLMEQIHKIETQIDRDVSRHKTKGIMGEVKLLMSRVFGSHRKKRNLHGNLCKSADKIQSTISEKRSAHKDWYVQQWTLMERTHAAERQRDEERIKMMQAKRRSEESGKHTMQGFNARGDQETAQHFKKEQAPSPARSSYEQTAGNDYAKKYREDNALGIVTNSLGGKAELNQDQRKKPLSRSRTPEEEKQLRAEQEEFGNKVDKAIKDEEKKTKKRNRNRNRNRSRGQGRRRKLE